MSTFVPPGKGEAKPVTEEAIILMGNDCNEHKFGRGVTIEEDVGHLVSELSEEDKQTIRELPTVHDTIVLHHGLGRYVRNHFDLWHPDTEKGAEDWHADHVSTLILKALWERLNEESS